MIDQPPRRSGALLDNLARKLRVRSAAVLAPLSMRPRHLVALTVIRDRSGILQSDLCAELQLDSTNVVGLLNELEADHLVERRRSDADRRRHNVLITEAGNRKLAEVEQALAAAESSVLGGLSTAERDALHDLLAKATNPTEAAAGSTTEACLESFAE